MDARVLRKALFAEHPRGFCMSAKCVATGQHRCEVTLTQTVRSMLVGALSVAACASLLCPKPAQGQSADSNAPESSSETTPQLKEIVVTAQKRAENIQTVPESVDAISSEEIAEAHVTQIDDLGNLVSNLNITTRADHTPDVVMRGVGSFGITQGVGFYSDDVQLFDGETVRMDDVERVEVLKGPQGVLYGGNNIGGAIKFITKLPTDQFEGGATLEYGEYDTATVASFASGPLISGSLDGRISAYYTRTGGYIYDTTLNTNVDAGDEYGGRVTLEHTAPGTTAILYINADQQITGAEDLYYRPASATDYSYQISDGTRPSFNRTLYSMTLHLEQDLTDSLKLTSISSFFHSDEGGINDVDKGPAPLLSAYLIGQHRVASEELRLSNEGSSPSKWMLGLFAQANDQPENYVDSSSFNGDPGNVASWSDPTLYSQLYTDPRQTHREYAVFGNEEYDIGAWSLQAGARIDHNRSTMADAFAGISGVQDGTEFMPRFSLSYHFTPDVMAYSTVARGFEPGDLVEGADANGNAAIDKYRPETAWSYEAGVKSTLDRRFRLDADVFYIDYSDRLYQINKLELGQFVNVTTNIGDSRNYGAELELDALLGEGFELDLGTGVTRAIWGNVPYYDPDLNNALVNLSGRFGPDTPAYTASLGLSWSHQLSNGADFGADVEDTAIGREYWDPTNHYYQPAYTLLNAGAHLDIGSWTLRAHGSNLLGARYNTAFISAAEVGAPFDVGGIGLPRSWVVSVSYRFN